MIAADSIRHSFGDREVLRDVALTLQQGEVVGLFGLNGAGKSVLLQILFGQLRARHVFISVDGRRVRVPYRIPGLITFRSQGRIFPHHLTVEYVLRLHRVEESAFYTRYPEFAGTEHYRMSRLNWRLFETLVLLEVPTRFTLLDEPYAGLSPLSVEHVQGAILRNRLSKGILMTDHSHREVLTISDRNYVLAEGALRAGYP
ncbi:ATP-binding cassette domain-containing protein [Neolewinella sp.]|uniref:ATP-binding cassette domain-containing protein n=1 Tax=Neolewinella sp. TaxID=2993543 RepID=UPI003B51BE91